ncbi:uncharacterized protein [Antedon mediterranea]|uniref:uncharacterized protein n=1 Tax=Antedon mediterranea TaxID=105859 RepID=UPI003AF83D40
MSLSFQEEMQNAFEKYYNHSNYPTTVANELEVLQKKFGKEEFHEKFVKPTQKLLHTLQDKQMPLYKKDGQTLKIIVHIALKEKQKVETGEFLFCVGQTKPGTLTLRFCKYITQLDSGVTLAEPKYDTIKMTVEEGSYNKCLTLDYLDQLRSSGKLTGTERTSVMLRLCWVKVLTDQPPEGFLKVYDAEDLFEQTIQKNPTRLPHQVSDEASFRSHHPMEMTRQRAYEEDSQKYDSGSSKPQQQSKNDPTEMESSSGNLDLPCEPESSDVPVVASKLPFNEWQSQSDAPGYLTDTDITAPAKDVNNEYVDEVNGVGPKAGISAANKNTHLPHQVSSEEQVNDEGQKSDPNKPQREWRDGPTGMGGEYVPVESNSSSDNINRQEPKPFSGVKLPCNEMQSEDGISSLKSNLSGGLTNIQYTRNVSSGPAALLQTNGGQTKSKIASTTSTVSSAREVDNSYVTEVQGVGPSGTSGIHSNVERQKTQAKEVDNSYVTEVQSVGPSGRSGIHSNVERHKMEAKEVDNTYVGESNAIGPSGTSRIHSNVETQKKTQAKEVDNSYVGESKAV